MDGIRDRLSQRKPACVKDSNAVEGPVHNTTDGVELLTVERETVSQRMRQERGDTLQLFVMKRTYAESTITDHTTSERSPQEVGRGKRQKVASSLSATCVNPLDQV